MIPAGTVVGDKEIARRFRVLPDGIRSRVTESIGRLILKLQRKVKQEKLSGQVLKVRTDTLRRSIDQRLVTDNGAVTGVVSTNVKYGKLHEYGFEGTVQQNVKAHLRRSKAQMKQSIKAGKGKPTKYGKYGKGNGEITVNAFTRTVHMKLPERSFLRSALDDMKHEILAELDKAVAEGIRR